MEMEITFPGGARVDANFGGFTIKTDQPPVASAPTPFATFLASIGTCPGIYVLGLWVADPPAEIYDFTESAIRLEVVRLESEGFGLRPTSDGSVVCDFEVIELGQASI